MKRRVAVDTGPVVALFDKADADHAAAVAFFTTFRDSGFVTTAVIAEATHLLSYHARAPIDFLQWIEQGALEVEDLADDLPRIIELMTKYSDQPMDFADATVVAACERLGARDVATLDADFHIYRFKNRQTFFNRFPM